MPVCKLTEKAEEDLADVWLHIVNNNPDAADRLVNQLITEAERLALHPNMGRSRSDLAPEVRSWVSNTPYLIFYCVSEQGITVLRFLHHSRDLQVSLFVEIES